MGRKFLMKTEKQNKKVAFIEKDEEFIRKMADDIGCGFLKSNALTYGLGNPTALPSNFSAFAWVHKEEDDNFWVATRKLWMDEVISKSSGMYFPFNAKDDDCVCFDTKYKYQETVKILKLINTRG
jgi:hypothetical protein